MNVYSLCMNIENERKCMERKVSSLEPSVISSAERKQGLKKWFYKISWVDPHPLYGKKGPESQPCSTIRPNSDEAKIILRSKIFNMKNLCYEWLHDFKSTI